MKTRLLALLLILSGCVSGCKPYYASEAPQPPAGKHFSVTIEQFGKSIPVKNHEATIEKAPFTIVFYLRQPDAILVNTSFNPSSFYAAKNGVQIEKIRGFRETGMAEYLFNSKRDIMISDEAPHYWFYDNEKEHRFNEVTKKDGILICKRTVENIFFLHPDREIVKVEDLRNKEKLFMVFMKAKWKKDYSGYTEFQREFLKITFGK